MKPIEKIKAAFAKDRPALMPYFSIGYPSYETSLDIIQACVEAGADLMELGLPFSDPLADGPTIQHSTQVALENGVTTAICLDAVRELRSRGIEIPFMLMGYYNPIFAYGVEKFVQDSATAGANGFIIPDLPAEEAGALENACKSHGMGLSYLLSSNTSDDRATMLTQRSLGFTYLVSVIGITGARDALNPNLVAFVERIRGLAPNTMPLAMGFGISTPEQARTVSEHTDGIIVGSALINTVRDADDPVKAAMDYVASLRAALG